MPYSSKKLITNAYYVAGIVSKDTQTVSGQQQDDGLELLNTLLSMQSVTAGLIPYYKSFSLNTIVGQEKYFIDKLISIETAVIFIDTLRLPLYQDQRTNYFSEPRVNVSSIPYKYRLERQAYGSDVYIYYTPSQIWTMTIRGKFGFASVTYNTDLLDVWEPSYIEYLKYALAEDICAEYGRDLPPLASKKLASFKEEFLLLSPIDLTMRKISSFGSYYGDATRMVNFYQGWVP